MEFQLLHQASSRIRSGPQHSTHLLFSTISDVHRLKESQSERRRRLKKKQLENYNCFRFQPAEGITKQDDTTSIASESPSRSARESPKLSETPLSQYFPPTMVGHPMYGSGFCKDGSPPNSDDMSDFGDCTGGVR